MAHAITSVRKATIARLDSELGIDVHDASPLRYSLPYAAFLRVGQSIRRISKTKKVREVRITFEVLVDPHEGKSIDDIVEDLLDAMDEKLSLPGFAVFEQEEEVVEVFEGEDENEYELKKAEITWLVEVY